MFVFKVLVSIFVMIMMLVGMFYNIATHSYGWAVFDMLLGAWYTNILFKTIKQWQDTVIKDKDEDP